MESFILSTYHVVSLGAYGISFASIVNVNTVPIPLNTITPNKKLNITLSKF